MRFQPVWVLCFCLLAASTACSEKGGDEGPRCISSSDCVIGVCIDNVCKLRGDSGLADDSGRRNDADVDPMRPDGATDSGTVDGGTVDAGLAIDAAREDAGTFDGSAIGSDAGRDAGLDAGMDAGRDAGFDAGSDAGFDAGFDARHDAGHDANIYVYDAPVPYDGPYTPPDGATCQWRPVTMCSTGVTPHAFCTGGVVRTLRRCDLSEIIVSPGYYFAFDLYSCDAPACLGGGSVPGVVFSAVECCQ